ncbi:MAG TPA: hypothetical protein VF313_10670 [Anaerolineaceae bacterium]
MGYATQFSPWETRGLSKYQELSGGLIKKLGNAFRMENTLSFHTIGANIYTGICSILEQTGKNRSFRQPSV